jgi:transposase
MVSSVDQLTEQRSAAKQRTTTAGRVGNYDVAELWREIADSKAPEKAMDAAEAYAQKEFGKELELLLTIPRIGRRTATYLLAQLMPIERFTEEKKSRDRSIKNIKRYIGMYPKVSQSGEVSEKARMAKSGNPRVRGMLFVTTLGETVSDSIVGRHFKRLVERGMPKKKAIVAASAKLQKIAYAVLSKSQPYNDPLAAPKPQCGHIAKEAMPHHLVTQSEAARIIGTSRQRVGQVIAKGLLATEIFNGVEAVFRDSAERYASIRRGEAEQPEEPLFETEKCAVEATSKDQKEAANANLQ